MRYRHLCLPSGRSTDTFRFASFTLPQGTQGILQGTYETLAELARQHFSGTLEGKLVLTGGLGGMGGMYSLHNFFYGGDLQYSSAALLEFNFRSAASRDYYEQRRCSLC